MAAATVWIAVSAGFSYYLSTFANYSATYGSLGAIAAAMMWAYISTFILLVGAELDAELEHQTARDTTVAPNRPLGSRGAVVADSVGKSSEG
jgi:membrane protein